MGSLWQKFHNLGEPVFVPWARSGLSALIEALGLDQASVVLPSTICPVVGSVFIHETASVIGVETDPLTGVGLDEDMAARTQKSGVRLCMPTRLNGFGNRFVETHNQSKENQVFCLMNDPHGVAIAEGHYEGDGLLLSFGQGKALDAGGGGALFLKDDRLRAEVARLVTNYAPLSHFDKIEDQNITLQRRALRQVNLISPDGLIKTEAKLAKRSWSKNTLNQWSGALESHLKGAQVAIQVRRELYAHWQSLFQSVPDCYQSPQMPVHPWRFIAHIVPEKRDLVVSALRARNIDIGTNYPALSAQFHQFHPLKSATIFEKSVINLWLDHDQTHDQRRAIFDLIEAQLHD